MFSLSEKSLKRDELVNALASDQSGALVVFEGWVRDHNQGKKVSSLEYQVYEELALKEGQKILSEAKNKFNLHNIICTHRHGHLSLGEVAVWIGATATHRDDAFKATRFVIDEIKHRLPIWKKEHYLHQAAEWVFCRDHHHVHFVEADYYEKQNKLTDQMKLKEAKVVVVGAGGLGCPALTGLAMAGVGKILIVDFDTIQFSNIHRQPLYSPNLVGEKKAQVAKAKLLELNPYIKVEVAVESAKLSHLEGYDLVLDCTDNMATKYFLHDACFKLRIPLVSASVFKFEGQIRTFSPGSEYGCLRCHVDHTPDDSLLGNCNDSGVLGAVTQTLGSMQASEATQFLQFAKNASLSHTHFIDLKKLTQEKIKNTRKISCSVCEGRVEAHDTDVEVLAHDLPSGMQLIDIRNLEDDDLLKLKKADGKIVLYCHRGIRSKRLAENFRKDGYSQFYSLKGGACSL